MTKDSKDNKRGCIVVSLLVILVVGALAYAMISTGTDPRSNGISPSGSAPSVGPAG